MTTPVAPSRTKHRLVLAASTLAAVEVVGWVLHNGAFWWTAPVIAALGGCAAYILEENW